MADSTTSTRPKSRPAAPSRVPEWEPSRNSIHRLIQLMDVAAINFHNFRQHTHRLPLHGTPAYTPKARTELLKQLTADYHAVRMGVFPHADHAPQQTAQRLADGANAAAFRMGIADPQGAINGAATWLARVGWITTPVTSECFGEAWKRDYAEQGERLTEYMACRQQLLTMLSHAGHDLPTTIHQRFAVAFRTILTSVIPPLNVEELQLMVTEATREESPLVACGGHTEIMADVTLGELEARLSEWERAKEAPRPAGVRVSSVADFLNRGYAAALATQGVTESQAADECVPGYAELHTLSIRLFRDDLNAKTCKLFRHALVDAGMNIAEASGATIANVLVRLRTPHAGVSRSNAVAGEQNSEASSIGNSVPPPPPTTSGQGKRPRPSVELAVLQYKHGLASLKEETPGETAFTDQEVYDNLKENDCPLPAAETWFRHVRSARQAKLLEAKNQPRTPYTGRSAVPASHRA